MTQTTTARMTLVHLHHTGTPVEVPGSFWAVSDGTLNVYETPGGDRRLASFAPGTWIYVESVDNAAANPVAAA